MRISRRAEYALRALILIASDPTEKVHQIQDLSERGNIPVKFLVQILLNLRNEGLLTSKRGVGGGDSFRKRPSEMFGLEILELLDGPITPLPWPLDAPAQPLGFPGQFHLSPLPPHAPTRPSISH